MKSLLACAAIALGVTAALFSLMAWMVGGNGPLPAASAARDPISITMVERPQRLERRQRTLPEPPPPLPPLPTASVADNASAPARPQPPSLPPLALSDIDTMAVSMPGKPGFAQSDSQAMPLYRVEPAYPPRAKRMRAEGFVVMKFTIAPDGRPTEITVMESQPVRLFDRAAVKALARWKYQPKRVDGKAVPQPGQTLKLEFRLQ
ncbi:outer membrane transport energization protein TonB [Ferrimonas sediminum]|uniref:Protein TonB n=1 Tax=Ferrimonas sediminum TaxID=718193 RepID=A0A1G8NRI5_9GAMM|nr:energy transducer TonB [Ferrimonas sediminum]SDI82785.1 outer membrane transport energization protein TonB [Ferrimonas sediminum]